MKRIILTLIALTTLYSCSNSEATQTEAAPVVDTTKTDSIKCIKPDSGYVNTLTLTAETTSTVGK